MTTIAPIKGMIRKRLTLDLTVSLGGGILAACAFWYGSHIPRVQQRMYRPHLPQVMPSTRS